ncbi:hypothetical protein NA78x_003760 [Anatilimnocola sp. NA78]|uniref:hypothetical protein n=1 Tax=Anatilimnocola sp. NA78 TaxID=3415683 RepID=UPI003CE5AD9A
MDCDEQKERRLQAAEAVMRRDASRIELARASFRQQYPDAAKEMIDGATFHVYVDGIGAAVTWLAETERFLRDPSRPISCGATYDLLIHVYNWYMLEALMPVGKEGMSGLLDDINEFAADGDLDSVRATVAQIKRMLGADLDPPEIVEH